MHTCVIISLGWRFLYGRQYIWTTWRWHIFAVLKSLNLWRPQASHSCIYAHSLWNYINRLGLVQNLAGNGRRGRKGANQTISTPCRLLSLLSWLCVRFGPAVLSVRRSILWLGRFNLWRTNLEPAPARVMLRQIFSRTLESGGLHWQQERHGSSRKKARKSIPRGWDQTTRGNKQEKFTLTNTHAAAERLGHCIRLTSSSRRAREPLYNSPFFASFSAFFLLSGSGLWAFFRKNFLMALAERSPSNRTGACLLLPGKK